MVNSKLPKHELVFIMLENTGYPVFSYRNGAKMKGPFMTYNLKEQVTASCLQGSDAVRDIFEVHLFARNIEEMIEQNSKFMEHTKLYGNKVVVESLWSNQDPETDGTIIHHSIATIVVN